jgi:hypothetical protein
VGDGNKICTLLPLWRNARSSRAPHPHTRCAREYPRALSRSGPAVRLGQDRLSGVRESQRVRVRERHPIPQRSAYQAKICHSHKRFKPIQCTISDGMNNFLGQEKVTIHPQASMRAKGWRGEKTNRMWVVEKPAGEEPSGQRFLTWVVRHLSWRCSRGRHPVEETGVKRAPGREIRNDNTKHEQRLEGVGWIPW